MTTTPRISRTRFLLALSLAIIGLPIAAQTRPASTTTYKLIEVKATGSNRFTQEEIAASSGLPVGTIAGDDDFRKAARTLGESGAFANVAFSYTYTSAGAKLTFQVTDAEKFVPAHFIDFVWFADQDLLKKVHERVPLFDGALPATGRLPDRVSDVLQALLVENDIPGHVDYLRATGKEDKLQSFDYSVSNVTIRIHQVEFSGAGTTELPLLQDAAEKLSNREYSHALLNSFVDHSLLPVYRERGYLKAACGAPQLKVVKPTASEASDSKHEETLLDVNFPVIPGIAYKVAHWEWSGNKEIPTDTLQPLLHIKVGQQANTVQLADDLRAVQTLYSSHGRITAVVKANAEFDDVAGTINYQLVVDEGAVFHMGELAFRGIDNSVEGRLRAIWKLRPGDVYDATYLQQFLPQARKLLPANMDWDVASHVTAIARDKTVDVDLQYTAKATH